MGTSPLQATRPPEISHRLLDGPINLCLVLKGLNIQFHFSGSYYLLLTTPDGAISPADSKAVALKEKFPAPLSTTLLISESLHVYRR